MMATIMYLLDEIITIILGYNDIEDIVNFRDVWKQFHSTTENFEDWERIFFQRWSSAKKLYNMQSNENKQNQFERNEQKNKRNFIEMGINYAEVLQNYVSQIIHKHYYDPLINKRKQFEYLLDEDDDEICENEISQIIHKSENFSLKYYFFIDELKKLITSSQRTDCDLTERYFNIELYCYLRKWLVEVTADRFKRQPRREHLLERTATFIAQWIQPLKDVFYSCVKASLDNIAQEALIILREKHPDHSIFSTSAEIFSYWRNNNIDDNHWNETEGTQIMDTLEECIFGKLNFRPCLSCNDRILEYICIDNVLKNKCGQEIIILVIYHSVARRLGLRCDIMRWSSIFWKDDDVENYILWKPKYTTNNLENARYYAITSKIFPDITILWRFKRIYPKEYMTTYYHLAANATMMWKFLRELLDASICSLGPFADPKYQYFPPYRHEFIIYKSFIKTEQSNTRPQDVKFAVGMIVTHPDWANSNCDGVIVGWDRRDDIEIVRHNIKDMVRNGGFLTLMPVKHIIPSDDPIQQPYYIILTENNKICFVKQDRLTLTTPKWINNSEIGRYFCKFEGTHYTPNKMLAKLYPHDAAVTAQTTI